MQKTGTRQSLSREQREAMANAERLKETDQVAAQPHRRGNRGDMADAFGHFVRRHGVRRGCYDAGQRYALKLSRLRRVQGIPARLLLWDDVTAAADEPDDATVAEWKLEIALCENAMKCSGLAGFLAARALIVEDAEPGVELRGPVRRAIQQLAICLGIPPG